MALRQHTNVSNTYYSKYGCEKLSEVDISIKHAVMTSCALHK
jgi:hypothetical protein